jgi:hypothetical protein
MQRGYTYYVPKQPRSLYSLLPFIDEVESFGPLRYEGLVDEALRAPVDMGLLRQGVLLLLRQLYNEELVFSWDDVFAIITASITDHETGGEYSDEQAVLLLSVANGALKTCKEAEDN